MTILNLAEAQSRLSQLIHSLAPGDEVVIVENDRPLAKVTALPAEKRQPIPGRAKGMLTVVVEDDEHLQDFEEYLP
jgi:antitoxin (DNA-binding transcriptional repressor) of toxin-antitoxin stability system